jgi:DNA topoisomerase-1
MLLIVESPSKCLKIESFVRCKCISSKGHIRELKKLPENPRDEPTYENIPEKKSHIESMRKVIKMYSPADIYLATDDDREGEAIAWHICQVFGLPVETTKRIIFHEVTKPALQKAVLNPIVINMNIVKAQQARQVLDLMVGFKISPLLWKYLYRNKDNSLSAGRCQTPALRLVYDNEKECSQAVLSQSYKIVGIFFSKKLEFVLSKELENSEKVCEFFELSKSFKHMFSIGQKKIIQQNPPRPFSTSSLLQSASSNLGMSPKETMSICQQLYQDGFITYMRTDAQTYSLSFLEEAKKWILEEKKRPEYVGDLEKLTEAVGAHEAIRVTHIEGEKPDGGKAKKLYDFIWKNTVASCMSTATMEQTPVYMSCPQIGGMDGLRYEYTIEVPAFLGWKSIYPEKGGEQGKMAIYFASCHKEQSLVEASAKIAVHGHKSHYTEAGLIKRLEDVGIGRPSTYASLVEVLMERGYVKKMDIDGAIIKCSEYVLEGGDIKEVIIEKKAGQERGKLVIQPTGVLVAEFLTDSFASLFDYGYTEAMEKDLDEMARGVEKDICGECNEQIERLIKPIEKKRFFLKETEEYYVVFGKYGPVIQHVTNKKDFRQIRVKIDMDRLRKGEYSLGELEDRGEEVLGEYEGNPVILLNGPFGEYIKYKEENIPLTGFSAPSASSAPSAQSTMNTLYDKFVEYYSNRSQEKTNPKIIRELTEDLSIRNGKYGAYIHYETPGMKKPQFYKLKGFKESYRLCQKEVILEWIRTTYNVG